MNTLSASCKHYVNPSKFNYFIYDVPFLQIYGEILPINFRLFECSTMSVTSDLSSYILSVSVFTQHNLGLRYLDNHLLPGIYFYILS